MGNQGIILRKVTMTKTLNHLNYFLKGTSMILLMYLINSLFIEKNFQMEDAKLLFGSFFFVIIGFLFIKKKGRYLSDNDVMQKITEYYNIKKFSDIEKLEKQLIKELKNQRKFITVDGQVVGTDNFLLLDFSDGQFMLLPIKKVKQMYMNKLYKQYVVTIFTESNREQVFFKKKKDASKFINDYQMHT